MTKQIWAIQSTSRNPITFVIEYVAIIQSSVGGKKNALTKIAGAMRKNRGMSYSVIRV